MTSNVSAFRPKRGHRKRSLSASFFMLSPLHLVPSITILQNHGHDGRDHGSDRHDFHEQAQGSRASLSLSLRAFWQMVGIGDAETARNQARACTFQQVQCVHGLCLCGVTAKFTAVFVFDCVGLINFHDIFLSFFPLLCIFTGLQPSLPALEERRGIIPPF